MLVTLPAVLYVVRCFVVHWHLIYILSSFLCGIAKKLWNNALSDNMGILGFFIWDCKK